MEILRIIQTILKNKRTTEDIISTGFKFYYRAIEIKIA